MRAQIYTTTLRRMLGLLTLLLLGVLLASVSVPASATACAGGSAADDAAEEAGSLEPEDELGPQDPFAAQPTITADDLRNKTVQQIRELAARLQLRGDGTDTNIRAKMYGLPYKWYDAAGVERLRLDPPHEGYKSDRAREPHVNGYTANRTRKEPIMDPECVPPDQHFPLVDPPPVPEKDDPDPRPRIDPKVTIDEDRGDCKLDITISVRMDPTRPTTLGISWGDGIVNTLPVPQGTGTHVVWQTHQYAHPLPGAPPLPPFVYVPKTEVITATIEETDLFDTALFVHGQQYIEDGSGDNPGLPTIGTCGSA